MKFTVSTIILLLVFQAAFSYEIEFSRTYNKVMIENNQLKVKLNSTGLTEIRYPEFYQHKPLLNFKASTQKMSVIDQLIQGIDFKVTNGMLQHKLKVIKRNHNLPLYYSSDVDVIDLTVSTDDGTTWSISLSNLAELKKHYELMGQWQPLIDLITEIQNWSQQVLKTHQSGGEL